MTTTTDNEWLGLSLNSAVERTDPPTHDEQDYAAQGELCHRA